MLYQQNKIKIFLFLLFTVNLYATEKKEIKKIVSDYTEFDRKTNTVNFFGNVYIETTNGKITCQKAMYNEQQKILSCEKNVYYIYISTVDNTIVETNCNFLTYDVGQQKIEFNENVVVNYKSTNTLQNQTQQIVIKSNKISLFVNQKNLICENNVEISFNENKIFCNTAEYQYDNNILWINRDIENQQLKIFITTETSEIKTCTAKTAVFYLNENKILLKGAVELVF